MTIKIEKNVTLISKHIDGSASSKNIIDAVAVIERLPVGVLICNMSENGQLDILTINHFAREIFNYMPANTLPVPIETLWPHDENHALAQQISEIFINPHQANFEWTMQAGVVDRYLSSQLIPTFDQNGNIFQVICTVEDQTSEKLAEKNLLHHAFHDALTGLPNRVLFRSKLEEAVADSQRSGFAYGCAVLIVNIDRFQQINESFGHSAGDRFLVSMATTLRSCIRAYDTLARLSGDEFAILVSRCRGIEEVDIVSHRIHDAMKSPYDLDGNEVFTSVSVGVATTMSSSAHPEDLIRDADFAMHSAKTKGKSRTEVYRRETHMRARSQFHLETELRRAVENNDLELYYQPIIDLNTNELSSFEALSRWNHKEKGFVSPAEFIPLAEKTGIIVNLGRWAIYQVCNQIRSWIDQYGEDKVVPVNVNVSAIQFGRDDVVKIVSNALAETKVPGNLLRIEITESTFVTNSRSITDTLKQLGAIGVKIALDDFGTGYSSLNYLHQFPIDVLKIDRSFIIQLEKDNQPYKILEMIAVLAKSLEYEVVAEGLEDIKSIEMLRDLSFQFGQGFYYSRPIRYDVAGKMLQGNLPWLSSTKEAV